MCVSLPSSLYTSRRECLTCYSANFKAAKSLEIFVHRRRTALLWGVLNAALFPAFSPSFQVIGIREPAGRRFTAPVGRSKYGNWENLEGSHPGKTWSTCLQVFFLIPDFGFQKLGNLERKTLRLKHPCIQSRHYISKRVALLDTHVAQPP